MVKVRGGLPINEQATGDEEGIWLSDRFPCPVCRATGCVYFQVNITNPASNLFGGNVRIACDNCTSFDLIRNFSPASEIGKNMAIIEMTLALVALYNGGFIEVGGDTP